MSTGTVKEVVSGDTIVIMGRSAGGPPPEMTLTLSDIISPRLGRRDGSTPDEPFAWAAKEHLRRLCIGRVVSFALETTNNNNNNNNNNGGGGGGKNPRKFAAVKLVPDAKAGQGAKDLSCAQVGAGFAKVKKARGADAGAEPSQRRQELEALEESAKDSGAGVWCSDAQAVADAVRSTENASLTPKEIYDLVKAGPGKNTAKDASKDGSKDALGKGVARGVVEYVHAGHMVRVALLPWHASVMVTLTGVTSPPAGPGTAERPAVPQGQIARFFAECRVLSRDVAVAVEGIDKHGNLFGTVRHEGGNLGEQVLRAGFGKVATWSIGSTPTAAALRAAEKDARDARRGVWQGYEPAPPTVGTPTGSAREFQARVVEIVSADTVVIVGADGAGDERTLRLANIRVPRMGRRDERGAPFAWEAREYVRQRLIGRTVKVFVDYVKPANDGYPERHCATLFTEKGVNVSEALVKQGFATVVKLRPEHEERSLRYDDLLTAEANAEAEKRGLHGTKQPPAPIFNDVGNQAKGKAFLPSLQRVRRIQGIVEHVFNGARLKVAVPKENCLIAVSVAGVRADRAGGDAGTEAGEKARVFTRSAALQRNVELEVYDCDRSGAMIAAVHVAGVNLAVALAEQGLAKTSYVSSLPYATELEEAEAAAKARKIGVWEGYVEPAPEDLAAAADAADADAAAAAEPREADIRVVDVVSGVEVIVHIAAKGGSLDDVERKIAAASAPASPANPSAATGAALAKKGGVVLAPFDGKRYRAKISRVSPSGAQCEVLFIDYGNRDVVESADLLPVPPSGTTSALPAQAISLRLAGLREAPDVVEGVTEDAARFLADLVFQRDLKARIVSRAEGGVVDARVTNPETGLSIGNAVVRAGMALVRKGRIRRGEEVPEETKLLLADQEIARQGRLNVWKYGDVDEDEDL